VVPLVVREVALQTTGLAVQEPQIKVSLVVHLMRPLLTRAVAVELGLLVPMLQLLA
jgi:hypothetical protein